MVYLLETIRALLALEQCYYTCYWEDKCLINQAVTKQISCHIFPLCMLSKKQSKHIRYLVFLSYLVRLCLHTKLISFYHEATIKESIYSSILAVKPTQKCTLKVYHQLRKYCAYGMTKASLKCLTLYYGLQYVPEHIPQLSTLVIFIIIGCKTTKSRYLYITQSSLTASNN